MPLIHQNTMPHNNKIASHFFLPYQIKWIQDTSRIKIMEKSRQIGISWACAYSAVRKQATAHKPTQTWVSSQDETQARLFIQDAKKFAQLLNQASTKQATPILTNKIHTSSFSLNFANGSAIHALSSNTNAQAGKRGTRILDEFALHPNPKKLFTIAYPGITWGGQLEIISTHRGSHNYFNRLIQEIIHHNNPKNISHHKVTLQDALEQGFLKKLKSKLDIEDPIQSMDEADYFYYIKNSSPDTQSFLQEFMCQPSDDNALFIHPNLIEENLYPSNTPWQITLPQATRSPNLFFLGIDLARYHDFSVFWLLESINGSFFTRHITTLKNTPFHLQEKILFDYLNIPNLMRVCIDQTGLGKQFTENAIRAYGHNRIEGITFTNPIKESLAFLVRSQLEAHNLKLPPDDTIRADFCSIKRTTTPSGNIRFFANPCQKGHADHFWALALALQAAKSPPTPTYYQPLSNHNSYHNYR